MSAASMNGGFDITAEGRYRERMEPVHVTPERLAQLQEFARRRGKSTADALDEALAEYLEWERQDYDEALAAVRQASEELEAKRGRPAAEFLADLRRRHDLSR